MTLRLYVAGASRDLGRTRAFVRQAIDAYAELGLEVVHDWTVEAERSFQAGDCDATLGPVERHRRAKHCLDAVARADVFVVLLPDGESRGAWIELGAALMLARTRACRVVVSGDYRGTLFTELADAICEDDAEAMKWLERAIAETLP